MIITINYNNYRQLPETRIPADEMGNWPSECLK
jgi:hypothetical protein